MKLNVLYQFNEKYAPFAGVSITSLLENNKHFEEIIIYILGEGLSRESKDKMSELTQNYSRNIVFVNVDKLILKMKRWGVPAYRGAYAANLRLFLTEILDDSVEKILYLDADTIVNRPLDCLIQIELGKASLAMVFDSLGGNHKRTIGLKNEEPYYNSGVILFDMKNWRENKCSERIIEYIMREKINYSAPDQDLLNIICKNEIISLDPKYNMQPIHLVFTTKCYYKYYPDTTYYQKEKIDAAVNDVVIYHFFRFLGEFPWHKGNLHPDNYLFDKYLAISPWNNYKKQKANKGPVLKIEKLLFILLPRCLFLKIFSWMHYLYVEKKAEISK